MIVAIDENYLDDFLKIRMDSIQMAPYAFSSDASQLIDRAKTPKDLQNKNEEDFILLAYEHDQVAGMVGCVRYTKVKLRHKAFVWGVFVYPEFRGQGIGKKLFEELIHRAKKMDGLIKLNLSVTGKAENALALYHSMGFEEYGREPKSLYWKGEWLEEIFMNRVWEE